MKYLILTLALLFACGREEPINEMPTEAPEVVDPTIQEPEEFTGDGAFAPYIKSFVKDAKKYHRSLVEPSSLSVKFGPVKQEGDNVIGLCYSGNNPRIVIGKAFWDNSSETRRMLLMYHELGHCLLNRDHREQIQDNTLMPVSIMHPYILSESMYDAQPEAYKEELFTYAWNGGHGFDITQEDGEALMVCDEDEVFHSETK